jgi:hypothetical protein
MLAVAPGAAGALLVVPLPARDADHALLCGFREVLALGTAKAPATAPKVQPLRRRM